MAGQRRSKADLRLAEPPTEERRLGGLFTAEDLREALIALAILFAVGMGALLLMFYKLHLTFAQSAWVGMVAGAVAALTYTWPRPKVPVEPRRLPPTKGNDAP